MRTLDQTQLTGTGNGFRAPLDLELVEDVAIVPFDRVQRQEQPLPDLVVRQPLGNKPQHLQLALAQRLDQRLGSERGRPDSVVSRPFGPSASRMPSTMPAR